MYTLKPGCPDFTAMDGPMKGHKFKHGIAYSQVPPASAAMFVMDEGVILPLGEEMPVARAEQRRKPTIKERWRGMFSAPGGEKPCRAREQAD